MNVVSGAWSGIAAVVTAIANGESVLVVPHRVPPCRSLGGLVTSTHAPFSKCSSRTRLGSAYADGSNSTQTTTGALYIAVVPMS